MNQCIAILLYLLSYYYFAVVDYLVVSDIPLPMPSQRVMRRRLNMTRTAIRCDVIAKSDQYTYLEAQDMYYDP